MSLAQLIFEADTPRTAGKKEIYGYIPGFDCICDWIFSGFV